MSEVDEKYEEAARASDLRLEQAAARDRERQEEAEIRNDPVMKLKQDVRQKQIAEAKRESVMSKKMNVVGKSTGKVYLMLWEFLLPSFGLTLIGIDIYIFMRGVLGAKLFPRLGDAVAGQMGGMGGGGAESGKSAANMAEAIGVPILNFIALMILLILATFIAILADAFTNKFKFWWNILFS